jgi:spore maturation protein CgeB
MPPAKDWEIPASGGLLFTNDFIGRELIFGDKLFVEYKDDCSDVLEKAEDILSNDYSDLAYSAWKVIGEKHLHSRRIKELHDILYSILTGKKVEDNWNIG